MIGIIVISIIMAIYIIQITDDDIIIESNVYQNTLKNITGTDVQNHFLFVVTAVKNDFIGKSKTGVEQFSRYLINPIEENRQLYDSLGPKNANQSTVVVMPVFTLLAYANHGFYYYYSGQCDEVCLTVHLNSIPLPLKFDYTTSFNAIQVFEILGYDIIADGEVDVDPSILTKYDRVILLHNEYVTQKIFDAITDHPKVIYLYPNALYAEISTDYNTNSITLIRGHGYPEKDIENGFDWEFENTHPYEFDSKCDGWEFYEIDNGFMLNCYPESIIYHDIKLLEIIRDL